MEVLLKRFLTDTRNVFLYSSCVAKEHKWRTAVILDLYQQPEKREQVSVASFERSKLYNKGTYAKNFFAALEGLEK